MSSKPCYYHDSHCHLLQFKNIDNVIKEASAYNVTKIVAVSMYKDENFEVLKLAQKYPNIIIPALGVHPIVISK
ncbi:MAG: TatD family hydrolase, partial [Candidatus Helarchaeota archaeon]